MFKKLLLTVTAVLLAASLAFGFDSKPGQIKEFTTGNAYDLNRSVVTITTVGTALGSVPIEPDKLTREYALGWMVGRFGMQGSGFVVKGENGKSYVITAAHVVEPVSVEVYANGFTSAYVTRPYKILSRNILVGDVYSSNIPAEIVWEDMDKDMVILEVKAPTNVLVPLNYKATWTYSVANPVYMLKEGDAITILVAQRDAEGNRTWQFELREGVIESSSPVCSNVKILPFFNTHDVTVTNTVYPGDSGSPVFAYIDGRPVLVGIARALYKSANEDGSVETHSYFVRIDLIKRYIDTR